MSADGVPVDGETSGGPSGIGEPQPKIQFRAGYADKAKNLEAFWSKNAQNNILLAKEKYKADKLKKEQEKRFTMAEGQSSLPGSSSEAGVLSDARKATSEIKAEAITPEDIEEIKQGLGSLRKDVDGIKVTVAGLVDDKKTDEGLGKARDALGEEQASSEGSLGGAPDASSSSATSENNDRDAGSSAFPGTDGGHGEPPQPPVDADALHPEPDHNPTPSRSPVTSMGGSAENDSAFSTKEALEYLINVTPDVITWKAGQHDTQSAMSEKDMQRVDNTWDKFVATHGYDNVVIHAHEYPALKEYFVRRDKRGQEALEKLKQQPQAEMIRESSSAPDAPEAKQQAAEMPQPAGPTSTVRSEESVVQQEEEPEKPTETPAGSVSTEEPGGEKPEGMRDDGGKESFAPVAVEGDEVLGPPVPDGIKPVGDASEPASPIAPEPFAMRADGPQRSKDEVFFKGLDDSSYGERGPGDEHMTEEDLIRRRLARGEGDKVGVVEEKKAEEKKSESWFRRNARKAVLAAGIFGIAATGGALPVHDLAKGDLGNSQGKIDKVQGTSEVSEAAGTPTPSETPTTTPTSTATEIPTPESTATSTSTTTEETPTTEPTATPTPPPTETSEGEVRTANEESIVEHVDQLMDDAQLVTVTDGSYISLEMQEDGIMPGGEFNLEVYQKPTELGGLILINWEAYENSWKTAKEKGQFEGDIPTYEQVAQWIDEGDMNNLKRVADVHEPGVYIVFDNRDGKNFDDEFGKSGEFAKQMVYSGNFLTYQEEVEARKQEMIKKIENDNKEKHAAVVTKSALNAADADGVLSASKPT